MTNKWASSIFVSFLSDISDLTSFVQNAFKNDELLRNSALFGLIPASTKFKCIYAALSNAQQAQRRQPIADQLDSLVPLAQTFTAETRHAVYTKGNHSHSFRIILVRKRFYLESLVKRGSEHHYRDSVYTTTTIFISSSLRRTFIWHSPVIYSY